MPLEETHWLPKNHLEVLDGHPDRAKTSLIRRYYYPIVWGLSTAGGSVIAMLATRRPLLSGIQYQIAAITAGISFGEFYRYMKEKYYQEQEARLKYYIQTHPDLFPDYEMVKIGDILEPWIPIR